MKKIVIFGKTLEYGLYVALIAFAIKTAFSLILGYLMFPVEYAGPTYYYWRQSYCDAEISKFGFTHINPNAEDATELFTRYSKVVQQIFDPKAFKKEINMQKELLEKTKSSSEQKKITDKIEEFTEKHEKDTKINSLKGTPLYTPAGFVDAFVYGPKKSFKVFKPTNDYNLEPLEKELEFLAFRHVFIMYLSALNDKETNFSAISKSAIADFFNADNFIISEKNFENGLKEVNVTVGNVKFSTKMSHDQASAVKAYAFIYPKFNELINELDSGKSIFTSAQSDELTVSDSIANKLYEIAQDLELVDIVDDSENKKEVFIKGINEFILRIASVKPNVMDSHILNRFYYYYLFTRSDLDLQPEILENHTKVIDLIKSKEEAVEHAKTLDPKSRALRDANVKINALSSKLYSKRIEFIFNMLSQKIAQCLGTKGYLLNSKDDTRMIPFKYFAYPSAYSTSKKNSVTSPFSEKETVAAI